MNTRSVTSIRVAKYGYIAISVMFCLAGFYMFMMPDISSEMIGLFAGVAMLIFGSIKLVGYFSKDLFRLAFQYDLQFGILLLILGTVVLINPVDAMDFVSIAFGICIIAECLFKIGISLEAKRFGIREWWITTGLASLAGIAGVVLISRPSEAVRSVIMLLGIALLVEGVLNLSIAVSLVKIVKNQKTEHVGIEQ